jgi:hypothetical protein
MSKAWSSLMIFGDNKVGGDICAFSNMSNQV